MEVFRAAESLKSALANDSGKLTIGLVPTMGALHKGHLSLVKNAKDQCDIVVVSIFVNPTQFDNTSDLAKYPRGVEKDLETLDREFPGALAFIPSEEEIYKGQTQAEHFDFGELTKTMEGKFRSGHFNGVGTILKKLFEAVEPHKAFFGEKDYQQLLIAKKLVQLTRQSVSVIGVHIVREENGLALSSRNEHLSYEKREEAGFIFDLLQGVKKDFLKIPFAEIQKKINRELALHPDFKLEYFEVAEAKTLKIVEGHDPEKNYRAFIAIYVENVRLIDNLALN